jgi:hypothetical protein
MEVMMANSDKLREIRDRYLENAAPFDLRCVHIFVLKTPAGGVRAAFVIDGRQYSDPRDMRQDIFEASEEMRLRRLLMEVETRPVEPDAPSLTLPTWQEYKRHLSPTKEHDS